MSSDSSVPSIRCPSCGERFPWRPLLAGRRVKCHCGTIFPAPQAPPTPPPTPTPAKPRKPVLEVDAVIEIAPSTPPPRSAPIPAPPQPRRDPQSIPVLQLDDTEPDSLPLAQVTGPPPRAAAAPSPPVPEPVTTGSLYLDAMSAGRKKPKPDSDALAEEDEDDKPRFIDFYLPLVLLVSGFAGGIFMFQTFAGSVVDGLLASGVMLLFQIFVFLPVGVGALSATARMMDVGFGTLYQALIKLLAVTIGTGAIADGLFLAAAFQMDFDQYVLMFGFFLYLVCCGVPLAIMFGIGIPETALLVSILMLPRLAVIFGLGIAAPDMFK